MIYHKISGVDKSICTAEQKIAYNLAFSHSDYIKRSDMTIPEAVNKMLELYRAGYDYKPNKYNEDAIFSCLNAGLLDYLKKPFIASSFDQIGKAFPAYYL